MRVLSQEEIDNLISCRKTIIETETKSMRTEKGHKRRDMRLRSKETGLEFEVFLRISTYFPENFCLGITHRPQGERDRITLLRCNGPHGLFIGGPEDLHSHFLFHIHRAKAENINMGLRAERGGQPTTEYASYREALSYFLRTINVENLKEHFPGINQGLLWSSINEESLQ
jgi:hypothetical protein